MYSLSLCLSMSPIIPNYSPSIFALSHNLTCKTSEGEKTVLTDVLACNSSIDLMEIFSSVSV